MSVAGRFARLPTAGKLLAILSLAMLPIALALTWVGESGIRDANAGLQTRNQDQARAAAGAIESLIARNALSLRIAAAGALNSRAADPCGAIVKALATAPAITRSFSLRSPDGQLLCLSGGFLPKDENPLVAPGAIKLWIDPSKSELDVRLGVMGGMVTARLPSEELRGAALGASTGLGEVTLRDSANTLPLVRTASEGEDLGFTEWPISNGALIARIGMRQQRLTFRDQLVLLLPVLMWVAAALISWLLVTRLLIRPLKRLQRSVAEYQPGTGPLVLPRTLGPSAEIQELGDAFARAGARIDESENEMRGALEGQRRLVREVHHRVKNNLQVIASLLNIHGRSAEGTEARDAYAGIGRRVGALSIVHRNHFAEMEENRGISLRPLISELAAELRAGAPEPARGLSIELDLDTIYTTQDVAVAVAFLITEIVEFSMLSCPEDPVEISLRRTSDLTGRLTLSSRVLVPEEEDKPEKVQFERIVAGLAKQLRSSLDRKLGRYSVDLPAFPPA